MKNSQTIYALLFFIVVVLLDISTSTNLDDFLKSVEEFHSNFHSSRIRQKRSQSSIDDLLSRFDEDEDQLDHSSLEAGDMWYQSFRAMECRHGGCPKKSLRWKTKKAQPEEEYDYYEDEEPNLQDQWDHTKNDLSHEANYKLSKIEQDAVEQSLPKVAWPIRHNSKRNVDPMQAIKLKTSLRMLQNGDGAVLPSSFLGEDRSQITVEDILENSQNDENSDPWKETYEVMESRKLLSVEDPDDAALTDVKTCGAKECLGRVIDMNQFDNIKQTTDLDRKLKGMSFDNIEESSLTKKGIVTKLSDQLMNSEAFLKFENFLKGKTDSGSESGSGSSNKTKSDSKTATTATTTTIRPTTSMPLNLVNKDRDVNIKLHMTVNATVLGNGNLPEQFHKNNTITFKPSQKVEIKKPKENELADYADADLGRTRRGVVFPILTSTNKRKAKDEISRTINEANDNFPLDELITGKLTSQLVHSIFSLVKTSPNLKILWPGLMNNKVSSPKQVQNFYAIRTHENESEMHRTELMLRQAMETINAIIEQQVRSRSCVPLRSDLKAFYNLILATQAENDELRDREKRETSFDKSNAIIDDTQIRQKSRIVKKLLKDYEELPREDQDRIVNVKDDLLLAAEELRELENSSRRRKRQIIADNQLSNQNLSNFPAKTSENEQFTPEYLKLARAAEMLLHNSLKDSDLTIDFNSI